MPIPLLMPALSPTMTEGTLAQWLKKEGDSVKAGEILAEIETDKATMELEAVDEGILGKIIVAAQTENVKVNQVIAFLLEEGENATDVDYQNILAKSDITGGQSTINNSTENNKPQKNTDDNPSVSNNTLPADVSDKKRILASPLAKKIAVINQINLSQVKGSGPNGRVVKSDVLNFQNQGNTTTLKNNIVNNDLKKTADFIDVPLNGMRKVIAKRLTEAKQNIPHFYLTVDCELDELMLLRQKLNSNNLKVKISVNDFIIRACAMALQANPAVNSTFHDNFIRQYHNVDIAVAVAIDGGLVTPIVANANEKSLSQISLEIKSLAERAKAGKLLPEEYQGGGFTVSNLGMYGVKHFAAIINPPQTCILAVGAGKQVPIVKNDEIIIANLMSCTLSTDHRAVDGALGAQFLQTLKDLIENPYQLLS
jgi:pyruvate dehydrogenase E2 component (dihydrolipoamide acetyltransferase)